MAQRNPKPDLPRRAPRRAQARAVDEPAAKPRRGGDADRLAAEVARLQSELDTMRAQMRDLAAKAERDPLTDLFNRRGFAREIARCAAHLARYGGTAAVVLIDLDGFKPVNDRHGHAAGDAVLIAVAAALARSVRASDLVARIGGDEFAVLLWNLTPEAAAAKARALEQAIAAATVSWSGRLLAVGASAGGAALTATESPDATLARADAAMYARKRARKRAATSG